MHGVIKDRRVLSKADLECTTIYCCERRLSRNMSVSGALPEKSESFRFAAYGRKSTAVADGLQDMLSRDEPLINR